MKSALFVRGVALCVLLAGQAFAQSQAQAPKSTSMQLGQHSGSPVEPAYIGGEGYGLVSMIGQSGGTVQAHLYDQEGTRAYTLQGDLVTTIICFAHGESEMQRSFYGVLKAPGQTLQVEGTWFLSANGLGKLHAVVFGPGEDGSADGPKIGRIDGFFQTGADAQQVAGDMLGASMAPLGQQSSKRNSVVIVDPVKDAALVTPTILNTQVPLGLRWKILN